MMFLTLAKIISIRFIIFFSIKEIKKCGTTTTTFEHTSVTNVFAT